MSVIRPFQKDDIPAIVALRERCFRRAQHDNPAEMGAHLKRIFFENPWYREDFPSLVSVNNQGVPVGFLGVIARPLRSRHEQLWLAVPTQFMVDPDSSGLIAFQILKKFMAGNQDISVADLATDSSRLIWERLGGKVGVLQSLHWSRSLSPLKEFSSGAAKRLGWAGGALSYVAGGADAFYAKSMAKRRENQAESVPITAPAELLACYDELVGRYTFWPDYDEATLTWLLAQLEHGPAGHRLRKAFVVDPAGEKLGWYVYSLRPDGQCHVVQLGGAPAQISIVIETLARDARRDGAARLSGRVQPEYLPALTASAACIASRPPWVLVNAKRKDLLEDLRAGEIYFSRLEGEWWLNF